jgi:hypothetical protein
MWKGGRKGIVRSEQLTIALLSSSFLPVEALVEKSRFCPVTALFPQWC